MTGSEINFIAFYELLWANYLNVSRTLFENFCHIIFQLADWHYHWVPLARWPTAYIFAFLSNQRIFGSRFGRNLVQKCYLVTWHQNFTFEERNASGSSSIDNVQENSSRIRCSSVKLFWLLSARVSFPLENEMHEKKMVKFTANFI